MRLLFDRVRLTARFEDRLPNWILLVYGSFDHGA